MIDNYYQLLTAIYRKDSVKLSEVDVGLCIALTKTLMRDKDNLWALKQVVEYLFYIEPLDYLFLLFLLVPRKEFVPKTVKKDKVKEEDNELLDNEQRRYEWSEREKKLNKPIVELLRKRMNGSL